MELDDDTKGDLALLKDALQERAGTKEDPLLASKNFNQRTQGHDEEVADFAASLKKLFKSAYPREAMTSAVLLQRFLTGLRPEIGRQLLLKRKPSDFPTALKDATDIEYALDFDQSGESINALTSTNKRPPEDTAALHRAVETLTKRLESLETTLQTPCKTRAVANNPPRRNYGDTGRQRRQRFPANNIGPCYNCGQMGHLYRNCHLNFHGPASRVDDSWSHRQ